MTAPNDKLRLHGMAFYGFHGLNPAERELGQRFVVDVELTTDLRKAGNTDRLEDTVNYVQVYREVKKVLEGPPRNLIENIAEAIAVAILEKFPIESVRIRVSKPHVPIKGAVSEGASVEIERTRRVG